MLDAMDLHTLNTPGAVTWSIARFNRACYAVALLWLGGALALSFHFSPAEIHGHEYHDFSQFYMGGLIAKHAAWEALYPIPHADSLNSPGEGEDSDVRPAYGVLAERAGVPEQSSRYIQPPPFALMLEPIALLRYGLAKKAWNLFMVLCAWGVAIMAGRSYECAARRRSPVAGMVALGVAVSPLMLETLRLMNVTPLIALLIGLSTFDLFRKDGKGGAPALVIGAAAKYATAILLPLYIVMRKWRAIGMMLVWTLVILGLSLWVMKTGPFAVFFKEMVPTLVRTHTDSWNRSLFALLMHASGPHGQIKPLAGGWLLAGRAMQVGSLLIILTIFFTRRQAFWLDRAHVFAGAAALVSWFLIFSPILWDQYFVYLVPFWGWMIWEARRSMFQRILIGFVLLYQCLPDVVLDLKLPSRFSLSGERMTLAGPYECFMLLTAIAILCIAVARLLRPVVRPHSDPQERRTTFTFRLNLGTIQFNRACAILAALWLMAATPVSLRLWPSGEGDFPQFYMGGVMARLHAWDSLYPIPSPGSHNNAGMETDSAMRPRYAAEAEKRGVGDRLRFIQPPPVTLLLMPMGYLNYHRAFELWTLMLVICAWGVAWLAGKFHEILHGTLTKASGLLMLFVACSPLMLHAICVANMTVPVALLTGIAILQLVRRKDPSAALAIVLGIVTKYVTIALLPLAFVMRRWNLLIESLLFASLLGIGTLAVMKAEPFEIYQHEIAPTLTRAHDITTNQSITAFLLRATHREVLPKSIQLAVLGVEGITLICLLWLLLRQSPERWKQPANVFAAAMALLTFLLIFSPIFWEHYPVYLCPLWGWLLWEARHSRGMAIGALLAVGLTYIPFTAWLDLREPYNTHILPSAIIMFGLAVFKLSGKCPQSIKNEKVLTTSTIP